MIRLPSSRSAAATSSLVISLTTGPARRHDSDNDRDDPALGGPQIAAWHQAKFTNAPTEARNKLIKRVKRIAFGFTRFRNYRARVLLYAGRPNWALLVVSWMIRHRIIVGATVGVVVVGTVVAMVLARYMGCIEAGNITTTIAASTLGVGGGILMAAVLVVGLTWARR